MGILFKIMLSLTISAGILGILFGVYILCQIEYLDLFRKSIPKYFFNRNMRRGGR